MKNKIIPITHPNQLIENKLLFPHYTDYRFNDKNNWKSQLIFIDKNSENENLFYNYSDRIHGYFSKEKLDLADNEAKSKFNKNTPAYFEKFLQIIFEKPDLKLIEIYSGVNQSSGFSYQIFGYKEK